MTLRSMFKIEVKSEDEIIPTLKKLTKDNKDAIYMIDFENIHFQAISMDCDDE